MVFCWVFQCAATNIVTCRKPQKSGLIVNYEEVCKGGGAAWEAAVVQLAHLRLYRRLLTPLATHSTDAD
jgi:hypothetical protein